jgi:AraC-type DNA-binding domain-containing proteins
MYNLSNLFNPIIAKPRNTLQYIEIPPSTWLKPYIRCFWGSLRPLPTSGKSEYQSHPKIIIPDACMDIVIDINHNVNKVTATFCGINDTYFHSVIPKKADITSSFGIRFYFWAVPLFADTNMKAALNAFINVEAYFHDFRKKLENVLLEKTTITDRIAVAEKYLLNRLQASRPLDPNILNAAYAILKSKGLTSIPALCTSVNISQRHLERLFAEFIGISPKKLTDIIRFQMLWQDMYYSCNHNFCDLAYDYQFSHQSHLVNSFKKYAGRTPLEALRYAKS